MKTLLSFLTCQFVAGCSTVPTPEASYHKNSKEEQKYQDSIWAIKYEDFPHWERAAPQEEEK